MDSKVLLRILSLKSFWVLVDGDGLQVGIILANYFVARQFIRCWDLKVIKTYYQSFTSFLKNNRLMANKIRAKWSRNK